MDPRNLLLADEDLDEGFREIPEPPKPQISLSPPKQLDTSKSASAYLEVLKQYSGQKVAIKLKEMELWAYTLGMKEDAEMKRMQALNLLARK